MNADVLSGEVSFLIYLTLAMQHTGHIENPIYVNTKLDTTSAIVMKHICKSIQSKL